jgi:YVTN family beta-propeller protein
MRYFRLANYFLRLLILGALFGTGAAYAAPFAYISNGRSDTVSVIDTATNTVVATVPVESFPYGVAVNPAGAFAYVTNVFGGNLFGGTVSVIDTATNAVVATVPVGPEPHGVAVNPAGTFVYVANYVSNNVSVIDTATNTVVATVPTAPTRYDIGPQGVAVNPAGTFAYVASGFADGIVSVIDTATNTLIASVPVGLLPVGVAVNPAGTFVYVTNSFSGTVSVIDTATNTVVATVPVSSPYGVAVNPAGTFAYVTNDGGTVSVIDTATNTVVATVPVGSFPVAFGNFIGGEVIPSTPAQMTSDLIETVIGLNFRQGVNLLGNALYQIKLGNVTPACNQLSAFIKQVQSQSGKHLTVATATQLIASAAQIKAALGCP